MAALLRVGPFGLAVNVYTTDGAGYAAADWTARKGRFDSAVLISGNGNEQRAAPRAAVSLEVLARDTFEHGWAGIRATVARAENYVERFAEA